MRNKDKKPLTRRGMCKKAHEIDDFNSIEILESVLKALDKSIGAHGTILLPFIGAQIEKVKECMSARNRRSQRLFVKWLLSECRDYWDFGTVDPYINVICKRYYIVRLEMLRARENKNKTEVL